MFQNRLLLIATTLMVVILINLNCNSDKKSSPKEGKVIETKEINKVTLNKCLEGDYDYSVDAIKGCESIAESVEDPEMKGKIYYQAAYKTRYKMDDIICDSMKSEGYISYKPVKDYSNELIRLANKGLEYNLEKSVEKSMWMTKAQGHYTKRDMLCIKDPKDPKETLEIIKCELHILKIIISEQKEKEVINPIHLEHDCRKTHVDRAEISRCLSEIKPFNYYKEQNDIIRERYEYIYRIIYHCLSYVQNKQPCFQQVEKVIEDPETKKELLNYLRNEKMPPDFPPNTGP